MPRNTTSQGLVTQTRTFNYDLTTARLTSATNPENGTLSYTYDSDGTLSKKTDAKNQQVQYTYDTYGRVTEKRDYASSGAEDLNNRVDYSYNVLGQVASTQWGQTGGTPGQFLESYGYGAGNLMASKTLQLTTGSFAPYISGSQTVNFSYNLDGQISGVSLPTIYLNDPPGCLSSPWCPQQTGPNYVYSFDTLGRHTQLKETVSGNVVANGVNYGGPAGQLSALSWTFPSRTAGYTDQYNETRQYNARGQMTRLQYTGVYSLAGTPPSVDQTYTYSSTANDGRLWQMSDAISGEVVQYQYDLLGRLTLAQTTGPQWGESFSYDGFGNLTSEVATKGTAFTSYQTFDPTTNRLVGGGTSYDANGNLLTMAGGLTMSYDEENRMAQAVNSSNATETDIYNPSGQLVYRLGGSVGGNPPAEVYIYGPQGQRLRFGLTLPSWSDNNKVIFTYEEQELYFAGKLLEADDRIGTSAVTPPTYYDGYLVGITTSGTFPYGELRQAPILGDRYATYLLDTTTNLNYAQHRWYSSQVARFTTVDPSGSANLGSPQSWNQYAYAEGDPINRYDPTGLQASCNVDSPDLCITTTLTNGGDPAFLLMAGMYMPGPGVQKMAPDDPPSPPVPAKCKSAIPKPGIVQIFANMGKALGIDPEFIMAISLQESGWNLSHVFGTNSSSGGQPLNNLFGIAPNGGNNKPFPNVQASATWWVKTFGAALSNDPGTIQAFVNDLQTNNPAGAYNSADPDWAIEIAGGATPKIIMEASPKGIRQSAHTKR